MDGAVKELGQTEQAQEMNLVLSQEQEQHLQKIGYTGQEIAAFKTSAKNESDVEFLTNLAEGDYENAFRVNPGALSDLCKLQLSNYEAILATRPGEDVYAQETQEQANVLFAKKTYWYTPGETNAYDYIPVIRDGLEQQSGYYSGYMQYMCATDMTVTDDYIAYGENLNCSSALWETFDHLKQCDSKVLENFHAIYGKVISDGANNIQIGNIAKDEDGQYGYRVNLVDPVTKEKVPGSEDITVSIDQKDGAADVLGNIIVTENYELRDQIGDLKQDAIVNTAVSVYDAMVPFPVKDGYEMLVSLDDSLNGTDLLCVENVTKGGLEVAASEDLALSNSDGLEMAGNALGIVAEVTDGIVSYYDDRQALESQIVENNQTLSMAQSGQYTTMSLKIEGPNFPTKLSDDVPITVNNVLPEVQYNMARWQKQGIDAYLGDLGIENTDEIKETLAQKIDAGDIVSELHRGKDWEITDEQVKEVEAAIDTMINGGDFSKISPDIFTSLQGEFNDVLENAVEGAGVGNKLQDWILKSNGVEQTHVEVERFSFMQNKLVLDDLFPTSKLNLIEPKLVLPDLYGGKLDLGDLGYNPKESFVSEKIYLDPSEEKYAPNKVTIAQEAMTR